MPYPPLRSAFHVVGVHVETSAEALVDGGVAFRHFFHEQFLFRRAHRHENHVGAASRNVVDQRLALLFRLDVAVAIAYDVDAGKFLLQFRDSRFYHLLLASHEVESLAVFVEGGDDFQPKLASGQLHGLFLPVAAQCHHGADAVAIADVAVDDVACLRRGVQNLFGIDGHQYAFVVHDMVQKLVERSEWVDFHSIHANPFVFHSLKYNSLKH